MPGMNGTGPMGQGPLTGGGRGPCGMGQARGFGRGWTMGVGMGRRIGRGLGRGYGYGRQAWQAAEFQDSSLAAPSLAAMEERLARLEAENQELRDRLKQQS